MGCKCAVYYSDDELFKCTVSGDRCMYLTPNSKQCAEDYGEGPDVTSESNEN